MSDEDFSRLLSLLSHELRSPLGVVRGYLKLIDIGGGTLTDHQQHAIAAALKASDRMAAILDQTSKLAQLQRGQIAVTLAPVAIDAIVNAAIAATILPSDPNVTIVPPDLPRTTVLADEPLLVIVYAALFNALARAQSGDTAITIVCRTTQDEGRDGLAVELRTPMSPAATERSLDLTRGGVGLDLPLVATLIAAHHSTVTELRDGHRLAAFLVWHPRIL